MEKAERLISGERPDWNYCGISKAPAIVLEGRRRQDDQGSIVVSVQINPQDVPRGQDEAR